MQVAALCYCNCHLTDGFLQYAVVQKLLCFEFSPPGDTTLLTIGVASGMSGEDVDWKMVAGWLVDAGIWEKVEGGFYIHDYPEYQPLKAEVLLERSKAQERMSKLRSPEVRQNKTRTNGEHSQKFNDPVPVPNPVPLPEIKEELINLDFLPKFLSITKLGVESVDVLNELENMEKQYPLIFWHVLEWASKLDPIPSNAKRYMKILGTALPKWNAEGFNNNGKKPTDEDDKWVPAERY
jgi:hypothetical protein